MEKKCDATVASFNWLNSPIVPLVVVPLVKNPATFSYAEEKHERKCKIITLSTIASFLCGFSSRAATRFTREKRR